MTTKGHEDTKKFGEFMKKFSETVGEIIDDPELKAKAKEFSKSAVEAVARVVDKKIKEEEVRRKIRTVGEAANTLGKSIEDNFKG
jgi:[ribosomal protein S5]-alanine N-acetyltransferase